MSSVAAWLKNLIRRPREARAASSDAATRIASEFQASPGHGVVLGVPGSGKTVLLSQLATRLQGCRVLLGLTSDEPPGWEEAPFWGVLRLADGREEDWDLEDVLCQRPEGVFELLVPSGNAKRVRRALSHLLSTCAGKAANIRPLWLTVDEPSGLVEVPTLTDMMRFARKDRMQVTVAVQSIADLGPTTSADLQHLCVLRASASDAAKLSAMTASPCEELSALPRWQCAYIRGGVRADLTVARPSA